MGSSTERNQVRFFLSSTFSDFMEERDLLAKQVFPSLRQRSRERGVEVVDVDLRWGITQETLSTEDFENGQSIEGLYKTLEEAGQLKEALIYAQKCFDHRSLYEGKDGSYTNRNRLDLARILNKLDRKGEALVLLNDVQKSFNKIDDLNEDHKSLLLKVFELQDFINQSCI